MNLSKIIKGEKVKVFNFFVPEGSEENFNSFSELLPEEAWQEIEKRRQVEQEIQEENKEENVETRVKSSSEENENLKHQDLDEKLNTEVESFDISQLSVDELLQHPEISKRIALLEQEAYEKGFAQGQRDGAALGKKQYETLTNRLSALVIGLEKAIEEHVLSFEPQLVSIVKTIVYAIIQQEVSTNPKIIQTSLKEALSHVVDQTRVRIHLNPDDMEFIEDIMGAVREELSRLKDFEIIPDTNIGRGGCILETDFGLIDATLERRFKEIFAGLSDESARS